ncbi:DNA-binding transcriptional MerR regulator [Thermosporothrix hazakensis]|jgi:DNA-binding transcriptional MerR regulator|uniref:DNA-binding transcriptional MerR regulator n=2 Tax=Thermosporothrix TaxID=768650 RepID=A0A326U6N3_THEHA|nr:MerR family transcriptional regulator [Thermosporothrix hazakensis]PZW28031.1 DNA-binding transcriptional MerR regulator [Thermosporothrix hazakensis]BBH86961.1 MerR family transcriptional regulator [Thermosporothrix sp. COM3]GCE51252.1 MerR family transcriptional regulator [Thermosporothrix hazakensis]
MKVGELAKATGASVRSLHYYEEQGVLRSRRLPNGYREYDASAIEQVKLIRKFLTLGLTLEDFRLLAPCFERQEQGEPPCASARIRYREKLAEIDERIADLQALRARVEQRLQL